MGLLKKVLGKGKGAEAEVEHVEHASSEAAQAATSGSAEISDNGHGTVDEDAPAWRVEARELGEKGQAALNGGEAEEAVDQLLEALKLYEAHDEEEDALEVSQYLGAALYDLGRQNEAVSVWEEIISRGCPDRPVYERLIDHYEELDRNDDVARVRLLMESIGQ